MAPPTTEERINQHAKDCKTAKRWGTGIAVTVVIAVLVVCASAFGYYAIQINDNDKSIATHEVKIDNIESRLESLEDIEGKIDDLPKLIRRTIREELER